MLWIIMYRNVTNTYENNVNVICFCIIFLRCGSSIEQRHFNVTYLLRFFLKENWKLRSPNAVFQLVVSLSISGCETGIIFHSSIAFMDEQTHYKTYYHMGTRVRDSHRADWSIRFSPQTSQSWTSQSVTYLLSCT